MADSPNKPGFATFLFIGVSTATITFLLASNIPLLAKTAKPGSVLLPCAQGCSAFPRGLVIERFDTSVMDSIFSKDVSVEILAEGFSWCEGPAWVATGDGTGYIIVSDVKKNIIYKWAESQGLTRFVQPSGHNGPNANFWLEPGSNGIVADPADTIPDHVYVMEHGNRRVSLLDLHTKQKRTLVDSYQGKRLNSPNDGAFRPGTKELYFTDPPYGFQQKEGFSFLDLENHPNKELSHSGLYRIDVSSVADRLKQGEGPFEPQLMAADLIRPNGIAFSPNGSLLYLSMNSDRKLSTWLVFDVAANGSLTNRRTLQNPSESDRELPGCPDGIAVDARGVVYATAPGGVYLMSESGAVHGVIRTGQRTGNVVLGGDGYLYIAADMFLLRVKMLIRE